MVNPDNPSFWDTDRWELANRRLQGIIDDLKAENTELKRKLEKAVEALEKVPNYSNYILCIVETEKALKSIRGENK